MTTEIVELLIFSVGFGFYIGVLLGIVKIVIDNFWY